MQYNLGSIEEIPLGEGREYNVEGTPIAVFRLRSGDICATQANCPHNNAPLCDGITGGTTVICPFHAWKFNLTTGEPILGTAGLKTYPLETHTDGTISVMMDSAVK